MKRACDDLRWLLALSLCLILGAPQGARSEEASAWSRDTHSAMRLIAGSNVIPGAPLRAGIELRLDNGWKTYWRYAGDSGVPTSFDFGGSQNAKSVTVLWPAPQRFADGAGGSAIGYTGAVIFPVHVVAENPAKPVVLKATASYGVCGKICIPARGTAVLRLGRNASGENMQLAAAEARVPRPAAVRAAGPLAIRAVHYNKSAPQPQVIVDVHVPDGAEADLFVEGPDERWALPLPRPLGSAKGAERRFVFAVDGVPRGSDIRGAKIRLTLVAGERAIEVVSGLD